MKFHVKSVDEVFALLKEHFSSYCLTEEVLTLTEAVNRITSRDILAQEDTPGFDRSMVDGYAVRASDTFGASDAIPAQLKKVGEVMMGVQPQFTIRAGETAYIPTGGELPSGCDSVVMIEHSECFGDEFVYLNKSAAPGNHILYRGDDTRQGARIIKAGQRLRPQEIGMLAAVGESRIEVKRKIRAGILSTGDEIVAVDNKIIGSSIRDVNAYSLFSALITYGAHPILLGIVKDDYQEIRRMTEQALHDCDLILISGGSSVGERDETSKVIASLGQPGILVHGIAVKPGKPTIIGKIGNKPVIGLPGHPVSAYMIYHSFIVYLMDCMNGLCTPRKYGVQAKMSVNYPSNHGREEFMLVQLENRVGTLYALPLFSKSGLITMLSHADGYVRIPRDLEGLELGQMVEVIVF